MRKWFEGAPFGVSFSEKQLRQFQRYYELLVDWNERMNLTAITDPEQVAILHFLDSVSCAQTGLFVPGASVADIGTGAGFPGIPLKICFPELSFTLVDALGKRLDFLETVCRELDLSDVDLVHARAEDSGKGELRESFDLVVSRAVASLPVLCEFCLPHVKVGGNFIAMKGKLAGQELEQAQRAVEMLGGGTPRLEPVSLPGQEHSLIVIPKQVPTPERYPRKAGIPSKKPL